MAQGPLRTLVDQAGRLVFRVRDGLLPAVFLLVLVLFPPPRELPAAQVAAALGLILLGQAVRVVTIGLAYIKRGGKDRRPYAASLVTEGIFAHCRNPMYLGNLLLAAGYLLLAGDPWGLLAGGLFFAAAYAAIIAAEETYLQERFGAEYEAYRAGVPRLLPSLRGLGATLKGARLDWRKVVAKEHGTLYLTLLVPLALLAWRDPDRLPLYLALAAAGTAAWGVARFAKKRTAWLRPAP